VHYFQVGAGRFFMAAFLYTRMQWVTDITCIEIYGQQYSMKQAG